MPFLDNDNSNLSNIKRYVIKFSYEIEFYFQVKYFYVQVKYFLQGTDVIHNETKYGNNYSKQYLFIKRI